MLGHQTPSSASDYIFGIKFISFLLMDLQQYVVPFQFLIFIKLTTYVSSTKSSLSKISKYLEILTNAEGLPNHFEAVRGRLT